MNTKYIQNAAACIKTTSSDANDLKIMKSLAYRFTDVVQQGGPVVSALCSTWRLEREQALRQLKCVKSPRTPCTIPLKMYPFTILISASSLSHLFRRGRQTPTCRSTGRSSMSSMMQRRGLTWPNHRSTSSASARGNQAARSVQYHQRALLHYAAELFDLSEYLLKLACRLNIWD